ncbi:MAG: hypothetical protein COB53_10140 [Elusimicrobia bacterium]|nr:MAG: hypothetical protein COB53_10140 [Elusimicrobiota bacterium]
MASIGLIEILFLLAPVAIIPAALPLTGAPQWLKIAVIPCAAGAVASYVFAPLSVLWGVYCVAMAGFGVWRFFTRLEFSIEETCIDAGYAFIAIGGGWFVLSRFGIRPMGFSDKVVLLTAVHFHYAAFVVPLFTGLTGRVGLLDPAFPRKLYWILVGGVLAGPPLLGAGITFSPALEIFAAVLLSFSVMVLACLMLVYIVPAAPAFSLGPFLLVVSSGSVLASMWMSVFYAIGEFNGAGQMGSVSAMAATHGILNVLGFSLCGVLGFRCFSPCAPRGD